jgi:hypothetical protein
MSCPALYTSLIVLSNLYAGPNIGFITATQFGFIAVAKVIAVFKVPIIFTAFSMGFSLSSFSLPSDSSTAEFTTPSTAVSTYS